MSAKTTLVMQRDAFEELYSQHQSARREHQIDLIKPLQQLNREVEQCLTTERNAYEKAKEAYHQEYNVLKRVFSSNASHYETQSVQPIKEAYHQRKDLAAKVVQLLEAIESEAKPRETRSYWNGAIAVVYNPITGRAEWDQNWHGGVHGVFNPLTGTIEWKKAFHQGVYGVFNPKLKSIEWRTKRAGGVHGVYNPSTGEVEWMSAFHSGVGGVYNPRTGQVEWKTCFNGGVVGWYDDETQSVQWSEKWHHGVALIVWDERTRTYLTTSSCGWYDDD